MKQKSLDQNIYNTEETVSGVKEPPVKYTAAHITDRLMLL